MMSSALTGRLRSATRLSLIDRQPIEGGAPTEHGAAGAQVTHGDMKAQNILITGRWAKIADVGVARVMAAPERADVTVALGTFAYAAPEMLLGGDWDTKADIYRWASSPSMP